MIDVRLKFILTMLAAVMVFSTTAIAQDFDTGLQAAQRGDSAGALREWRPLAERGDASAQTNLGLMYGEGRGIPRNDAEAVRWFRMAAEQGQAEAQMNLGLRYFQGRGVHQDDVLAHKWFNLAAAHGLEDAKENREIMASNMTTNQIAEAQKLAREWLAERE